MSALTNGLILMDLATKLSGAGNYLVWKTFLKQVLHSRSLIGYTDGSIKKLSLPSPASPPSPGGTVPKMTATTGLTEEQWEDRNGRVLAQITVNCSETIMIALDKYSGAAEAWNIWRTNTKTRCG